MYFIDLLITNTISIHSFLKILAIFWHNQNSYAPHATEKDESLRCHKSKMRLKDRGALKSISRVDTINVELHSHLPTRLGKSNPVGKRFHDKNPLTLRVIIKRPITSMVESRTFIAHFNEQTTTASTQRYCDIF